MGTKGRALGRAGGRSRKRAEGGTSAAAGGRTVIGAIGLFIHDFDLDGSRFEDMVRCIFDGLLAGRLSSVSLAVVVGWGVFALPRGRKL